MIEKWWRVCVKARHILFLAKKWWDLVRKRNPFFFLKKLSNLKGVVSTFLFITQTCAGLRCTSTDFRGSSSLSTNESPIKIETKVSYEQAHQNWYHLEGFKPETERVITKPTSCIIPYAYYTLHWNELSWKHELNVPSKWKCRMWI